MNEEANVESMLSPIRVLDLSDEKGFLCGKVLGDFGADVIKIEKPGGDESRRIGPFYHDIPDPEKSLYWFAFNMHKRSITLDIETADGKEMFKKLVKTADIVVETFEPGYMEKLGLGFSELSKINPGIIMTSITPFGQTGPYKDFKATDIVSMALSGMMYSTGDPDRAPVRISFPQSYLHGGVEGAVGSLSAYAYRQATGEGQQVDVSIQATMLTCTNNVQQYWAMNELLVPRGGPGTINPMFDIPSQTLRKCKDGYVSFQLMGGAIGASTTKALIAWMDENGMAPDWLKAMDWDNFDWYGLGGDGREVLAKVYGAFEAFFSTVTKAEILVEASKRRIFMEPVSDAVDILNNPQLKDREFFEQVKHEELDATITYPGAFFKSSETPWRVQRRAPLIGEHNQEIYGQELGISKKDLVVLKQAGVI